MALLNLILTLVTLLFLVRAGLLRGLRAAPWGIALVVCWLGVSAGLLAFAPNPIPSIILVTLLGVASTGLIRDWKHLARANADLEHYRAVVLQLEQRHDDHEAGGARDVAHMGRNGAGGGAERGAGGPGDL